MRDLKRSAVKPFVLTLLIAICLLGCHHQNESVDHVGSNNVMNRLPAQVAASFQKNHPHVTPTRVHARIFPDGSTRYQIIYVDKNGQSQTAGYYADGRPVPS